MNNLCRAFLLLTLPLVLVGCNLTPSPPPIVIGHVSDKTRADKAGDQAELGLRLALHDLNKGDALTEVFAGRPIQIRHTDTRGQLDAFESQAVRLDSVNRSLALFGGLSGPETLALNNAKLPLLTFHGQTASGAGSQVFYLGMSPAQQGTALATVAALDPKAINVFLLVDERRPESTALGEAFEKTLTEARKEHKTEPASVRSVRFGKETKWDDLGKRLQALDPDVIVFAGAAADFNAWHKIASQDLFAGNRQVFYAGDDGDHRLFDLEGDAKSSVTLATAFYADPKSATITAFMKAYREAFSSEADVHSALAYDGFRILIEAMKGTRTQLTPDRVREELLKTKDFDGLTGPLTITPDRQVLRPLFVVRWQNGTLTANNAGVSKKGK